MCEEQPGSLQVWCLKPFREPAVCLPETTVLATCGIRPPVVTFENTQSRLLLLADSPEEE